MAVGMKRTFSLLSLLAIPATAIPEVPPEYPAFNDRVQINASNILWPDRVFIRWKLSDGRWWCTYDTKEKVRAAMIRNIDDMLSPYGSGATSWRDVNLMLYVGAGELGVFEKTWCFSWLP